MCCPEINAASHRILQVRCCSVVPLSSAPYCVHHMISAARVLRLTLLLIASYSMAEAQGNPVQQAPDLAALIQEKQDIISQISLDTPEGRLAKNTNDLICALLTRSGKNESDIKETNASLSAIQGNVSENTQTINILVDRFKAMEFQHNVLQGRVVQLENEADETHDILNDIMSRQMRNNVIIRSKGDTYKEVRNETNAQTIVKFKDFLRDEMGIANAHSIKINRCHRMGKAIGGKNQPMIALIPDQEDIDKIFDKVSQLKDTDYSITIQTPPDYNERKSHAYKSFKDAKNQGKRASLKHDGQLFINGNRVSSLEAVPIPSVGSNDLFDVADEQLVGKSEYTFKDTHSFIAHSVQINSLQELRDALDIFSAEFTNAKHIPYAFRIRDAENRLCEDFKSRRDLGAGPQILKHMRDEKAENVVTFLAHGYNDKQIDGKAKFSLVQQCVKVSLNDLRNVIIADNGGGERMSDQESEQSSY